MSQYQYDILNILNPSALGPSLNFNNSEVAYWEFVRIVFGKVNEINKI